MWFLRPIGYGCAAIIFLLSIWAISAAIAQTPAGSTSTAASIDFTQILLALISASFSGVGGISTYLINKYIKNKEMATLLSNAVQNSLGIVQQKTTQVVSDGKLTVQVGDPNIAAGVNYVLNHAAEAVSHYNIPTERIAEKIEAKLGLAEIATNLAATASATPIIAAPLTPAPQGLLPLKLI